MKILTSRKKHTFTNTW